jgi:hypothetical protein
MMLKCNAQIAGLPRTDGAAPKARRCRDDPHQLPGDAAQTAVEHDRSCPAG